MSLLSALRASPPPPGIRSKRSKSIHLAGHAIALAAFERHCTVAHLPSDLCGRDPIALCVDGPVLADRDRAIVMAAGHAAEFYGRHVGETETLSGVPRDDVRYATRIDLSRAIIRGDAELEKAERLSGVGRAAWDETAECAVDLVCGNWFQIEQIAEAFTAARTEAAPLNFDDLQELMADIEF